MESDRALRVKPLVSSYRRCPALAAAALARRGTADRDPARYKAVPQLLKRFKPTCDLFPKAGCNGTAYMTNIIFTVKSLQHQGLFA